SREGQGCSRPVCQVFSAWFIREARFMSKHVVATVGEIPPGQRKLVTVRGRSIAVFNLDGEFYGLFNRCPHQGGPMCEGILTGLIQSSEPGRYEYSRPGE